MIQLSYHYEEGIKNARIYSQIKTIQAMANFLENYEHEGQYQRNRIMNTKYNKYNGNDPQQNQNRNNNPQTNQNGNQNSTHNNNPNNNHGNNNYRGNNHFHMIDLFSIIMCV